MSKIAMPRHLQRVAAAACALLLCISPTVLGYWQEECGGDPAGGWALPDKQSLDCALRSLGHAYGTNIIGGGARGARGAARLHRAFNLELCNVSQPAPLPPTSIDRLGVLAVLAADRQWQSPPTEFFVDPGFSFDGHQDTTDAGSPTSETGSEAAPFRSVHQARDAIRVLQRPRGPLVVWLRNGLHFAGETLVLDSNSGDSGDAADAGVVYAGYPGETAVVSGGQPVPGDLKWEPVTAGIDFRTGQPPQAGAPQIYRAMLKGFGFMKGLFLLGHNTTAGAAGVRLTRARYPNCDDITDVNCYTLNASAPTGDPNAPVVEAPHNVEVVNQNRFWMTNGSSNVTADPHEMIAVDHSNTAWRCPHDCGWIAYSQHRAEVCHTEVCRFDQTHNVPYWKQHVSGGFYYNHTATSAWAPSWTPRTWANASTAIVHMYHSARWGGWQFALHSRNDTDHSLLFKCNMINPDGTAGPAGVACPRDGDPIMTAVVQGGWQEGRGSAIGAQYTLSSLNNSYFVENIKEELDIPGEFYYDETEQALYIIPPVGLNPEDMKLVATKLTRVVQFNGTSDAPLQHVGLHNVTLAHTATTFMETYEIPSGGDWSIVRHGAVFADGAAQVAIDGCNFDQVDGNGIFFSRFVRNSSVARNDFYAIGDSAVLMVGAAGQGRIDNSKNREYPAFNVIEENHVDTNGVWVKQSAAYFKAVTRANVVRNNVFHDGPRSGINYNDGFAGGEVMSGNLLLNYVKESNDHGPFNSWDRQPFVYRLDEDDMDGSKLGISPQTQTISNNLVFNFNFHGQSCGSIAIDFDDETSQMNVTENVLVYGAIKTFDGMDRSIWDNLILYAHNTNKISTSTCLAALQSNRNVSSQHTHFWDNECVLPATDNSLYECGAGPGPFTNKSFHVDTHSNKYYFPDQKTLPTLGGCFGCFKHCTMQNFSDWQAYGLDVGSTLSLDFSDKQILTAAGRRLGMPADVVEGLV